MRTNARTGCGDESHICRDRVGSNEDPKTKDETREGDERTDEKKFNVTSGRRWIDPPGRWSLQQSSCFDEDQSQIYSVGGLAQ